MSDSVWPHRQQPNQAPLSLGFSRQEHWSGLPFPSPMHESEKWKWSCSVVSDSQQPHGLQPTRLLRPWDFPGKVSAIVLRTPGCTHRLPRFLLPVNLACWLGLEIVLGGFPSMPALILSLKGMLPSAPIKHAFLSAWQLSATWEVHASSLEACTRPNHPLAGWRMPGKFSGSLVSFCSGAHRESDWCLLWTDPRESSWKGRGTAGPTIALLMACEKGPGVCLWGKWRLTPCCVLNMSI